MNEIMNVMKERRSIRKFKPDMPSKEDLNQIIEAGLYAASGMGKQAAIIVAVTNKELRDKLSEMNRRIGGWEEGFDPFYGAPAVLVVLADKNCPTHVYDGSLVMGNMMLEAKALDLGSIWIHRAKEEFELPEYKQLLKDLGVEGEWEGFDPFYGAPAVLVVLADKNCPTHVYDGSLVMGNMMLEAKALDLGSIWIHRAKEEFELPEYKQLLKDLGVEGEWEGIGHCVVGYADGDLPKAAPRKENRVFWVE